MWREKGENNKTVFHQQQMLVAWRRSYIYLQNDKFFCKKKNILNFFWISGRVFLLFVIKKINKKTLIPSAGKNTISINKKNITFSKKYFPQLQIDAGEASTLV